MPCWPNGDTCSSGKSNEDWIDVVAFYLNGSDLIERHPATWDVDGDTDVDGRDVIESVILEQVTQFRVERVATAETHYPLLDLTIAMQASDGTIHSLNTRVRVGRDI